MATDIPAITTKLYGILEPLTDEDRQRVVGAAMTMLGSPMPTADKAATEEDGSLPDLPAKAKIWAKQNGVTAEQLEQVFHFGAEGAAIIATVPGKNNAEKSINAYLLTGIAKFLSTGDAQFTDDEARATCTTAGCYDASNHSKYLKNMGNSFSGSKAKGWTLTAPGLKAGATRIKEIAGAA
jgi:hypothetical protein